MDYLSTYEMLKRGGAFSSTYDDDSSENDIQVEAPLEEVEAAAEEIVTFGGDADDEYMDSILESFSTYVGAEFEERVEDVTPNVDEPPAELGDTILGENEEEKSCCHEELGDNMEGANEVEVGDDIEGDDEVEELGDDIEGDDEVEVGDDIEGANEPSFEELGGDEVEGANEPSFEELGDSDDIEGANEPSFEEVIVGEDEVETFESSNEDVNGGAAKKTKKKPKKKPTKKPKKKSKKKTPVVEPVEPVEEPKPAEPIEEPKPVEEQEEREELEEPEEHTSHEEEVAELEDNSEDDIGGGDDRDNIIDTYSEINELVSQYRSMDV